MSREGGEPEGREEDERAAAWDEFVKRSVEQQNRWATRGYGKSVGLSPEQRLELARLRAAVRDYENQHEPRPPPPNDDLPF